MLNLGLYSGYVLASILCVLIGAVFMALQTVEDKAFLAKIFFVFLIIGICIIPLYYEWLVANGYKGFSFLDDNAYSTTGWSIARRWMGAQKSTLRETSNAGYFNFTACVYYIIGKNTLAVRVFNVLASAMSIVFAYRIARCYFNNKIARRAALIFALLPNCMYFAINQFKESLIILTTAMILYAGSAFVMQKKLTISQFMTFVLGFLVLFTLRYSVAVFLVLIIFGYFYLVCVKQLSVVRLLFVSGFLLLIMVGITTLTGRTSTDIQTEFSERVELSEKASIASRKEGRTTTEQVTSFARIYSYSQLYKLPVSMLFALIIPYPPLPNLFLDTTALPLKVYGVANFIFVCLVAYILAGWFYLFKHETQRAFLLYFLPLFFIAIIAIAHLGVLRYKEQWILAYAILAAVGIEYKKNYRFFIILFNILILFIGPLVYLIVKTL